MIRATPRSYADRVLGCLLGGAVGDALGYGVEFNSLSGIRERFGPTGIQEPVLNRDGEAEVSDDTQMTLFTLAGLLAHTGPNVEFNQADALEAVRLSTLDWYGMQTGCTGVGNYESILSKYAVLGKSQAPGMTCLRACKQAAAGTPEHRINNSKGCGGVMRVAPVGLCPELSYEQAFELAARCAAQTHSHPSGYLSAGAMATLVRGLLDGLDPGDAVSRALDLARRWPDADETIAAVEYALTLAAQPDADPVRAVAELGEGWVGEEALAIGLYAALAATEYTDAVRIASNHGGDSDSTAAIAGQIYGAWKGQAEIPVEWIRRLDALDAILDAGERMIGRERLR